MTLKVNNKDVWLSGTIVQYGSEETLISNSGLEFAIEFSDTGAVNPKVEIVSVTNVRVKFKLSGFDNSLGTSYQTDVGQVNGSNLNMRVCVHAVGDAAPRTRVLSYTFLVG